MSSSDFAVIRVPVREQKVLLDVGDFFLMKNSGNARDVSKTWWCLV